MKKIYALAAAAMVALGMNAQNGAPLYITGDGGFAGGEWAPETADEFNYANGEYTITIDGVSQFKISTVRGDWDAFNAAALTCNYGTENDAVVALEPGDGNIKCPSKGDWTITVAGDLSTIKLHTDGEVNPVAPEDLQLYLRGGMNDWTAPEEWALTRLEKNENGYWVYEYYCDGQIIEAGTEFKIAAAEWSDMNIGAGDDTNLPLDESFDCFRGDNPSNFVMTESFSGILYMEINFENYDGHVYLSNDDETENPYLGVGGGIADVDVENVAPVYFNLQGVRVANAENGIFIVKQGNKVAKVVK